MALTPGAAIRQKVGLLPAISDPSVITNTSFNTGTVTQITLADDVTLANAVLVVTMAVAPAAGSSFHLYRRDMNINGAGQHADVPDANNKQIHLGSFKVAPHAALQNIPLPGVPVSEDQEFYIENDTGQSTAGTTVVKITPWTYNGKA